VEIVDARSDVQGPSDHLVESETRNGFVVQKTVQRTLGCEFYMENKSFKVPSVI